MSLDYQHIREQLHRIIHDYKGKGDDASRVEFLLKSIADI